MVLHWKNLKVQRHQQDLGAKIVKALDEQVVYFHFKASWMNGQFIMSKKNVFYLVFYFYFLLLVLLC